MRKGYNPSTYPEGIGYNPTFSDTALGLGAEPPMNSMVKCKDYVDFHYSATWNFKGSSDGTVETNLSLKPINKPIVNPRNLNYVISTLYIVILVLICLLSVIQPIVGMFFAVWLASACYLPDLGAKNITPGTQGFSNRCIGIAGEIVSLLCKSLCNKTLGIVVSKYLGKSVRYILDLLD